VPGFNRKTVLHEALKRLSGWFGKALRAEQAKEYGRALRFVPPEALEEIVEKVIDETPATPGRFPTPTRLLEQFYLWRAAHPEKRAHHPTTKCKVCRSQLGLLHGAREQEGITYRVVARCAACQNWMDQCGQSSCVPLMTPEQLEAQGYELEYPPQAPLLDGPLPTPEQLASRVGQELGR
jgi:hypothetical protein